jgi:hypothetical protein
MNLHGRHIISSRRANCLLGLRVYGGFDTRDLKEAKALLGTLAK